MSLKNQNRALKITSYSQFNETLASQREAKQQQKIQENEAYIEYIKKHDKEAYEKYLSYATYLECCK